LHPAAGLGFAAFHVTGFPDRRPYETGDDGSADTIPATRFHPSKNSPRRQPFHVTVAVAPLPFPPVPRSPFPSPPLPEVMLEETPDASVGFEALLHHRVRSALPAVASRAAPYPSMGFGPLQGSSREPGSTRAPRSRDSLHLAVGSQLRFRTHARDRCRSPRAGSFPDRLAEARVGGWTPMIERSPFHLPDAVTRHLAEARPDRVCIERTTEAAADASYIGAAPPRGWGRTGPDTVGDPGSGCRDRCEPKLVASACRTRLSGAEVARSAPLSPPRLPGSRREAHIVRPSWGS
jgi:hypothetical protein